MILTIILSMASIWILINRGRTGQKNFVQLLYWCPVICCFVSSVINQGAVAIVTCGIKLSTNNTQFGWENMALSDQRVKISLNVKVALIVAYYGIRCQSITLSAPPYQARTGMDVLRNCLLYTSPSPRD